MRGLVMDHAADKNVRNIDNEFMFGPALLVCPVTQYKAVNREVYLPATSGWYDLQTGTYYEGGKSYLVDAPLGKVPVFAKAGAIIPMGPEIQYTDEKLADPLTLFVFEGADGSFTLYEDDGTSYDYEKGMFSTIGFKFDNSNRKLTITAVVGQYPGMLRERKFNIVLIKPETGKGIDSKALQFQPVTYQGKELSITLN
jgi:alpha-D-xyloside xylohydrolase